jgi:hypothetical protein
MIARTLAALALAGLTTTADTAEGLQSFRADYSVSILGLNIARSSFESTIGPRAFSVSGTVASSGIARIFDQTEGTAQVRGNFVDGGAQGNRFLLDYVSGKKKKRTDVAFSRGTVTRAENTPPRKPDPKAWVPVKKEDLRSVSDPLSASLVKADSLRDVCDRTIRVFDGEMRMDLKLSYVRVAPAQTRGFSGDAVTCRARFVPIGGYKGGHRSIEFLKNRSKILISFAPLGTTGVYAPIKVSATTEIGTVVVNARRFESISQ